MSYQKLLKKLNFLFLIFPEKNKSSQMALHPGILELVRNKGVLSGIEQLKARHTVKIPSREYKKGPKNHQ